ncbi:MAG TPA: hypothetical protein VK279_06315, partial [Solirubrobacteraceae bacterium]|nr:hypothetical protein [Solirubrobacteraceae bacterium]
MTAKGSGHADASETGAAGITTWDEAYERLHRAPDRAWAAENLRWGHDRGITAMTFALDPRGRTWFAMVEGALADRQARDALGEEAWLRVAGGRPGAFFARV